MVSKNCNNLLYENFENVQSETKTEETLKKVNAEVDNINQSNQGSQMCKLAFNNYDLYNSSNPFVVKGKDIDYSFKNQITDVAELVNIGNDNYKTFGKLVSDYDPNSYQKTDEGINKLFVSAPKKLGCCLRKNQDDNSARTVVVRTPLNPYEKYDQMTKKFDFKFKTLNIPENSCPVDFYAGSNECNTLYEAYCKNIISEFNKKNFKLDDFKNYSPECACYAPKYEKELIYPNNTPPACYKLGCKNILDPIAYVDPISRNNQCDILVCQNIFKAENISAENGNININATLQNSCGKYLEPPKDNKKTQDGSTIDTSAPVTPTPETSTPGTPTPEIVHPVISNDMMIFGSVLLICLCVITIIIFFIMKKK